MGAAVKTVSWSLPGIGILGWMTTSNSKGGWLPCKK